MEKLNQILSEIFKLPITETCKDLSMYEVSTWDSLSHMDLIVAIENEFNIQLTGDDIAEMITFNSIRDIVSKYI